jgi:hypothetical protein
METSSKRPITEISKVPYYGDSFPIIPRKAKVRRKELMAFIKLQYKETGFFPTLSFWLAVPFRLNGVYHRYKEGLDLTKKSFCKQAKMEWAFLFLIYNKMLKRKDEEYAYDFIKKSIQVAAPEGIETK